MVIKNCIIAKCKGFTLVEVILSMTLLGLIVTLAFSLFFFGLNTFGIGEKQADVQFDVRMASQFISREVRYAKEVEILDKLPLTLDDSFYMYIITDVDGTKYIISKNQTDEKRFAIGNNTSITFSTTNPEKTLYFNISDVAQHSPYNIESEVYVQNLDDRKIKDSTGTSDGKVVRFRREITSNITTMQLDSTNPQPATKGLTYTGHTFSVTGAIGIVKYTVDSGALPAGISLSLTGSLSGTPTIAGDFMFIVKAVDSKNQTAWNGYTLNVIDPNMSLDEVINSIFLEQPASNETSLRLPAVPSAFSIEISKSSDPTIIDTSGNIYPDTSEHTVTLTIKISNQSGLSKEKDFVIYVPPVVTGNHPPEAFDVQITGDAIIGKYLSGFYIYTDADKDQEGASKYQWYRSMSPSGTLKEKITGATGLSYLLSSADKNYYIFFEVQPVAINGAAYGEVSISAATVLVQVGQNNAAPIAKDVSIIASDTLNNGNAKLGAILTGEYDYEDTDNDSEWNSTFVWYRSSKQNGSDKAAIPNQTGSTYKVTEDDYGSYIFFEVTPKASTGNTTGIPVISSNIKVESAPKK